MGSYQSYKGNPENKLFYIVDQLIGGINTDFSDDTSPDNEFKSIVNFTMDKRGSLYKRMGFGKLNAISQIFNMYNKLPETKGKTPEEPNPEYTNDNIVYMKMLKNDNNCFRNLSAFSGEKAYREYQKMYGSQHNEFELLMITTSLLTNKSTAWLFKCRLPELIYLDVPAQGEIIEDTIEVSSEVYELPVVFEWDRNLSNIDTIEFFDKIYFTGNNKGLVCFDRTTEKFTYNGENIPGQSNNAYKPSPMEIRKIGFNVLGDNPLYWIDYQGLSTDSIQGIYLTLDNNLPLTVIPNGTKFRINILYTGNDTGFSFTFKEGETEISATTEVNDALSSEGLKVYDVMFKIAPTSEVEIKITKTGSTIDDYYDYYEVGVVDPETKPVEPLNIGDYGMCEMYNRAVYYKGDTIWFSELNNFNYVPNYNYVSLPIEPTDEITKIVFFKNVYIIFTKQRIYKMLNSFGSADFQLMPVNLAVGCHAPNTVIPVENELYFASPRGLYSLRSSEYREGIENLRELDTKVKQLTSDVTMYLGERTDPAVRYNGISEAAYAVRYKDKYMLFFNTAYQKGDIAALQNLDALVYHYDLKAFTEIKFPIKPTFLFMLDGAIETYCSVPEDEEYTDSVPVFAFDFNSGVTATNKVIDKTGNGYDADVVGGAVSGPGKSILLNGDNSYIQIGNIPATYKLVDGFTVDMSCTIDRIAPDGTILFNLKQAVASSDILAQTFTIKTDYNQGYAGELICNTYPNNVKKTNTIKWTFRWYRNNTDTNGKKDGKFKLLDKNGNVLIPETSFNFDMGDAVYQDVLTGSFTVQHDGSGNYADKWQLIATSSYPTYSTEYEKGSKTTFDKTLFPSWSKDQHGIRLTGTATAKDGGCDIVITNAYILKAGGKIALSSSRNMYVWVDGTKYTRSISNINGEGPKEFPGSDIKHSVSYKNGSKSITIDAQFNLRATIAGTYRENIDVDAFSFTLPSVKEVTVTTWHEFSVSKTSDITLNKILDPTTRDMKVFLTDSEYEVGVYFESENGTFDYIISSDISVLGDHVWDIDLVKRTSSTYELLVYIDYDLFGSVQVPAMYITDGNRDKSIITKDLYGSIDSFTITSSTGVVVLDYDFKEGKGTTIKDKSGNGIDAVINGDFEWVVEEGLFFDGKTGYLKLPTISSDVKFSNGFSIEFEGRFDNPDVASKVIDLAVGYDTGSSDELKCSINAGKIAGIGDIIFKSTSASLKSYKISTNKPDITERHKYKASFINNGKGYDAYLYVDDELISLSTFAYGGITNIERKSNFIGKSNNPKDKLFEGVLYNLSVNINASSNPVPIYVGAMYEYDTTFDDFGRPMEIELETKGMNLQYPMHSKKLKHIYVKGLGGYNFDEFFFELYADGHLVNDPKEYSCYVDETTNQIVYDYDIIKELNFTEKISLLGNMRLNKTKLGESTYETRKLVIPTRGKNFTIKIYGESSDYLSIESFGFTFKLGKVREE